MTPDDPYEFVDLLVNADLASVDRNRRLAELARVVHNDPVLAESMRTGEWNELPQNFREKVDAFIETYGDLSCTMTGGTQCADDLQPLVNVILQYAALLQHRPEGRRRETTAEQVDRFLDAYDNGDRQAGQELLELARASYRLRDDDNIHLGRIEAQLLAAVQEAGRRIEKVLDDPKGAGRLQTLQEAIAEIDFSKEPAAGSSDESLVPPALHARQLTGQPAGPGLARGRARVIHRHSDLPEFKSGEMLVCDAVDPNMTFVVPLAAAVVERRGGMLIHGAIIAREYGLPCVTGISNATSLIQTGDTITVDGYLGIVTVHGEAGVSTDRPSTQAPKTER
jgi:pyruvate,water dikinase